MWMFIFNIAQVLILNVTETVENYSNLEIFLFRLFSRKSSFFRMHFAYWKTWINPALNREKSRGTKKTENLWRVRYISLVFMCPIEAIMSNSLLFTHQESFKSENQNRWQGKLFKCWNKTYLLMISFFMHFLKYQRRTLLKINSPFPLECPLLLKLFHPKISNWKEKSMLLSSCFLGSWTVGLELQIT